MCGKQYSPREVGHGETLVRSVSAICTRTSWTYPPSFRPSPNTEVLADSGYQGLSKLHEKSRTPRKKPRKSELTGEQKRANRESARRRVVVEHVIRSLKIFRILAERYRNRRQRFYLRFNLIAGQYNYELSLG